jgi:TonB family protein
VNSRRSNLTASVVIHVAVFALLWALTALFPGHAPEPAPIDVVFYKPPPREPLPPPVEVEPEPEPRPAPPPPPEPEIEVAEVQPPPPKPKPVVKPKPEPVKEPEVAQVQPKMEARPKRQVITAPALAPTAEPAKPERPRREVKTALLNAAATKPATRLDDPPRKATTGAFAATDKNDPNPPSRNLRGGSPKVGGFQVAEHTAPAAQKPSRTVSRSSGFGNSDPAAEPGHGGGNGNVDATVSTGGFGSSAPVERPRGERKVVSEKPDTPVEILSKPTPAYTAEARELRIEGEVSLRVTFLASGEVRVLEVLDGLGHGLDEAAMDAAKRIRFKPARRERLPVDHTTVLRIVFQLV